jgi:hypothetical protein
LNIILFPNNLEGEISLESETKLFTLFNIQPNLKHFCGERRTNCIGTQMKQSGKSPDVKNAKTYAFQGQIPRLPVPKLRETCDK